MGISDKAMMGRDGFLFLNGSDSNDLVGHLQGTQAVLPAAHHVHRANRAVIDRLQVPFLGIIVPEAHCLYPERLPDGMAPPADTRPVHQVRGDMAGGYAYPLDIMLGFKADGMTVYTGRDSHWTQAAALQTYLALRGRLGRDHPMELAFDPADDPETGDLTFRSRQDVIAAERRAQARKQIGFRALFASSILNHGNILVIHNPKGRGRCLAFGTSFSSRLTSVYASDFETVVFCYGTTIDPFMVDLVQPDCVIAEMPERFLHFPALSVRGSTLIGMLLGLAEPGSTPSRVAEPQDIPDHAKGLVRLLQGSAAFARGKPASHVLRPLEGHDMDLARRVALLGAPMARPGSKRGLRLLLSGQFYNRGVLGQVFQMIDAGQIGLPEVDLIPDSESGLLALVRIHIRADLPAHADIILRDCIGRFGASPEAQFFDGHIRRMRQGNGPDPDPTA